VPTAARESLRNVRARGACSPQLSDGRRERRIALAKPLISGVKKAVAMFLQRRYRARRPRANLISIKSILTGL